MATSSKSRRKHRRQVPTIATLNLTSMMDIFTILLLFLLKSFSAEGQIVTIVDNLELPVSTSSVLPKLMLNLIVTTDSVMVDGVEVETIENIINSEDLKIEKLASALLKQSAKSKYIAEINENLEFTGDITIQADKSIPFRILKKIMYTCGQVEYSNISLAVFASE